MLQENKNNIKGMWKVLWDVMGNKVISSCPQYFINEQNKEIRAEEMADEFNSFFVNIGPNLVKSTHSHNEEINWKGESKVVQSLYLGEVSETEVISIVQDKN